MTTAEHIQIAVATLILLLVVVALLRRVDPSEEIRKLKSKAAFHRKECIRLSSGMGDAGYSMARYINPMIDHHIVEFNRTMDQLAGLDPTTPKGRM